MKMTTEELVTDLRNHTITSMWPAAERLEELHKESKNTSNCIQQWREELNKLHEEKKFLREQLSYLQMGMAHEIADGKKAREEVERLKQERTATVNQQLTVRPEPSRLEIAAMLLAALAGRDSETWEWEEESIWAVEQADALIAAAAKEAK